MIYYELIYECRFGLPGSRNAEFLDFKSVHDDDDDENGIFIDFKYTNKINNKIN
jgi:hypothetical protein